MKHFEPTLWNDEMSVGVDAIDNDHRKLLSLLNEMEYIVESGMKSKEGAIESVLTELIEYTEYHFDREETLMRACDYPGFENHWQAHQALKGQVRSIMHQFRRDPRSYDPRVLHIFLRNWLVEHILKVDKQYESWMQNNLDTIEKINMEYERSLSTKAR